MKTNTALTLSLCLLGFVASQSMEVIRGTSDFLPISSSEDNDQDKTLKQIVQENGWLYEEYSVVTSDGYVLTVNRIPGRLGEQITKKPVVFMQHALDCDASEWVLNSPDKAPAFNLAEAGFDVWMGNNRGSRLSMKHIKYDPSKKDDKPLFWNFDFEDMGVKDLPSMIDFVLEKTGQSQLGYVGHSEGTTQLFIGMSMMPEYFREKLNLFVALAPPTRISNT